jgi:hypothetical protein
MKVKRKPFLGDLLVNLVSWWLRTSPRRARAVRMMWGLLAGRATGGFSIARAGCKLRILRVGSGRKET